MGSEALVGANAKSGHLPAGGSPTPFVIFVLNEVRSTCAAARNHYCSSNRPTGI